MENMKFQKLLNAEKKYIQNIQKKEVGIIISLIVLFLFLDSLFVLILSLLNINTMFLIMVFSFILINVIFRLVIPEIFILSQFKIINIGQEKKEILEKYLNNFNNMIKQGLINANNTNNEDKKNKVKMQKEIEKIKEIDLEIIKSDSQNALTISNLRGKYTICISDTMIINLKFEEILSVLIYELTRIYANRVNIYIVSYSILNFFNIIPTYRKNVDNPDNKNIDNTNTNNNIEVVKEEKEEKEEKIKSKEFIFETIFRYLCIILKSLTLPFEILINKWIAKIRNKEEKLEDISDEIIAEISKKEEVEKDIEKIRGKIIENIQLNVLKENNDFNKKMPILLRNNCFLNKF